MIIYLHDGWALIEPYLKTYGAFAVFVMIYLESFGMPVPGETGVVAASLLAGRGELSIVTLFLAVFAGAVLGDGTGYLIGRLGGRRLLVRFGPYVRLTPERLAAIEGRFRRQGVALVFAARFIPILRQINGVIAGSLAMPWQHFFAAQAAGALLWTAVYCLGPYFFGHLFR